MQYLTSATVLKRNTATRKILCLKSSRALLNKLSQNHISIIYSEARVVKIINELSGAYKHIAMSTPLLEEILVYAYISMIHLYY